VLGERCVHRFLTASRHEDLDGFVVIADRARIEGTLDASGRLFRIGHLGDLNDLMVLGALAGAEMAMRDVGIDVTLGSGVASAQAHFRKTIMAKEKPPTEEERFAETHPEGVVHA
jgi:alanine-glyoxylate transaminase / serine-glyoxylate transaminase / serine-pyruvate transaminase